MKQFIVDRHTTPSTPTLEQVPTEKIPIYDDIDAAAADIDYLTERQPVATKDTGHELSNPVDAVESGNLHAVTSNAVSKSLSYSETEQKTGGKWIDGKPIYRKIVDIGALPNATTKTVAHNISNYGVFTTIKGIAFNSAKTAQIELPYVATNAANINYAISIEINGSDIQIITGINRTSLSGYAILEYTKTTD